MTKEEISQYIIDKKIPLSFIWEDGNIYYLEVFTGTENRCFNENTSKHLFPNFDYCFWETSIIYEREHYFNALKHIWKSERETIEECLGEFFIWWGINKGRCKSIKYYEKVK